MGKKDMLVVSAHAADYCTRAGGTIAKYVRAGWNVRVVAVTFGARGESGDYWRQNPGGSEAGCGEVRRRESRAAADCLGAGIEFWGYSDYPLHFDEERQRRLTRTVLDLRPDLVLTHWTTDPTNPDHEATGRAVVMALASGAQIGAFPATPAHYFPNLFFFESTVPYSEFNQFSPDVYLDIDSTFDLKMEAIKRFECQPQLGDYYAHFARHRGFQATSWLKRKVAHAEGFKRFFPHVGTEFPLASRD
ncbi:MAG: PIG-L family deacetylase [Planctomycetota bacterium]|nr:PIG-L family deacetylase [Planctomycetota bacterium]